MVDAKRVFSEYRDYGGGAFAELVAWEVPQPVRGSSHKFKYRFAFVVDGVCVLRYDNEAGKGDHKHVEEAEHPIAFSGIERLRREFHLEARGWLRRNRGGGGD